MLKWLKGTLSRIAGSFGNKQNRTLLDPTKLINSESSAFRYDSDGFTVIYKEFSSEVKWSAVSQISVFKLDLITIDRIDMDIVHEDMVLSISEDLPGWAEFLEKLHETFPEIPKDWYIDICLPAFATNFSVIYNRSPDIVLTGRRLELKLETLVNVGGDSDWNVYYLDSDGSKWIKSYPDSGYHGGGLPILTKVAQFPDE
ncbi:hypothetical protein J2Y45_000413 [Dyadobacter sp. BE34]|uniref:Uncharacterized protein n=1 Tax=Dyadobacter fermentans TaxID=94254 RepID=A0ABU1QPR2_9BACT|nr:MULTISPECIES: Imm27 family immunity protein [Dyadobacter]MDR6803143.1 hypothetical protein [Dyadobacter fermentans]MDR7040885.1 hypothetical protein [Dyadobacter sp. BE242]MDR7195287.1 hypothetical protein [Dyadobacter sp. BE34]MDR7214167.1 hypothetical protein [Dyadobacter sp. BE31]MDR7260695.1 hypothetical protein [Dyadobacter sp. BE32]